ncbi:unnamed protein product [Leptidea sinapis]|uniref:Uncharacterized protein n=1 Tax=Leptidea sinapis TaxID=189913 RepID=A0A5E4QY06_9NEOP|nr:unnamed protein product [Leptidea sinapis]
MSNNQVLTCAVCLAPPPAAPAGACSRAAPRPHLAPRVPQLLRRDARMYAARRPLHALPQTATRIASTRTVQTASALSEAIPLRSSVSFIFANSLFLSRVFTQHLVGDNRPAVAYAFNVQ